VKRLPVILITGFLGSGKTTCLRHIATTRPQARFIFLVNELAEVDVDAARLLGTTAGAPHSVVGGSLFCECKSGDFLRILREQVVPSHRQQPLDALIIETSGMANPEAIGTLLKEHGLAEICVLHRIITIVSPAKALSLLKNLPVARSQVAAADGIVLNKCDLVDPETVIAVERALLEINPIAEHIRTSYCEMNFDFAQRSHHPLDAALSTCDANPFSARVAEPPRGMTIAQLRQLLEALPAAILRVKGSVQTVDGQFWSVDRTVDSLCLEPSQVKTHEWVAIAHDDNASDLDSHFPE
jgi:G3E family GTPase